MYQRIKSSILNNGHLCLLSKRLEQVLGTILVVEGGIKCLDPVLARHRPLARP